MRAAATSFHETGIRNSTGTPSQDELGHRKRHQPLTTFMVLAAMSVVVRRVWATAALVELIDIIVLYRALWLLVWLSGVHQYIPIPFPELAIAAGLTGFNRYLRGRAWGEMTLRPPGSRRAWVLTIPLAILSIAGLAWWYFFVAERPHPLGKLLPAVVVRALCDGFIVTLVVSEHFPVLDLQREIIHGYHVKRVIGTGGVGTVYEAVREQPRRNSRRHGPRHLGEAYVL